jgi:protein-S-isoprenylcysteine O-methyltransferase Ste14
MEYGMSTTVGVLVLCLWVMKCAFVFRGMGIRLSVEDGVLQNAFDETWNEYARKVPYNFLPGLI